MKQFRFGHLNFRLVNAFLIVAMTMTASVSAEERSARVQSTAMSTSEVAISPALSNPHQSLSMICSTKWQGPNAGWLTGWFTGNERYAVYQDPLATGCVAAYPFTVTDIVWRVTNMTAASLTVQMRPTVYAAAGSMSCQLPGNEIVSGPTYGVILPAGSTALVTLPLDSQVCVTGPFFAGIVCPQFIGLGKLGINVDSSQVVAKRHCASYNDFRGSWEDLIVADNFPGNIFIWSQGLDAASGSCFISGACCSGSTGNVDCDPGGNIDIADLTALVDHLFINFTPLCCIAEANVDSVGGVDIADLTLLVDNLFISFTPLPNCP